MTHPACSEPRTAAGYPDPVCEVADVLQHRDAAMDHLPVSHLLVHGYLIISFDDGGG